MKDHERYNPYEKDDDDTNYTDFDVTVVEVINSNTGGELNE